MKKIVYSLILLAFAGMSCEDDSTADISRITYYPTFSMEGDDVLVHIAGDPYTDPGVTALEGEDEIEVTKSVVQSKFIVPGMTQPGDVQYATLSEVDEDVPGMYTVTYTAVNKDGYSGTTQRIVFVLADEPDPSVDLSGTYTSGTSPTSVVTKVADGVFFATNVWGGGSTVRIGAYVLTSDGVNLNVPQQDTQTRIFGYGTRNGAGTWSMSMSRPLFSPPLIDLAKVWTKQ